MARIAGGRHDGMLGGTHVGGSEAARDIVGRMARTAIGTGQIWNMRGREYRRLDWVVVVVEGQRSRRAAVAQTAVAADAGVQHRDGGERRVAGSGGANRRVANRAG